MKIHIAEQLAALSHPKRLDLFRLLMRRYPGAVPAEQIATALELKANAASTYLSALQQAGLIEQHRVGTSLDLFDATDAPPMDFVITVCDAAANQECPVWPGHLISGHWGRPDPLADTGAQRRLAIEAAYEHLQRRIHAFVSLPLRELTAVQIQHGVDEIGRMQADGPAGVKRICSG